MKKQILPILYASVILMFCFTRGNSQTFTDIGANLLNGIEYSSVAWGDYNNDGYLDILLTGRYYQTPIGYVTISKIYRNNGDDTFTDIEVTIAGLARGSATWLDFNNDGELDFIISGYLSSDVGGYLHDPTIKLYKNNGNETFTEVSLDLPALEYIIVTCFDYNNDGYTDILLNGYDGSMGITKVLRNNKNETFTDINILLPDIYAGSIALGDYNNDSYIDILLTGYNGSYGVTKILHNNSDGTFTEINTNLVGVFDSSCSWGDYNNDGNLDVLLTGNTGTNYISKIYKNNGNGIFIDINASLYSVCASSSQWGDYDNDGYLDIIIAGYDGSGTITNIYKNNDNDVFTDIILEIPGSGLGDVAWADYNNDGLLDVLITGMCLEGQYAYNFTKIFRNNNTTENSKPNFPTILTTAYQDNKIFLQWNKSNDNETPQYGLSYNVRIGTQPNAIDMCSPIAKILDGYRKIVSLGNSQLDTCYILDASDLIVCKPYYFSVQTIDHCYEGSVLSSEDTFFVPLIIDVGTNLSLTCGGSTNLSVTTNYNGSGELSYTWHPSNSLDNSNIQNPIANPIETTTYYVTVTSSDGCDENDSITVFVNPIIIDTGIDKTITCGSSTNLTVSTNYNGAGVINYSWNPAYGLNDPSIQNPVANPLETTKYYVTVTSSDGCESADSITVFVNPISLNAGNDKTITCSGSTNLTVTSNYGGSGILNYSWYPEVELSSTSVYNPVASPLETTTYYVTATSTENCSAVDSVTVYVIPLTVNAGIDKTITCGGATNLSASTNCSSCTLNYSWFPSIGLNNPNLSNPIATPNSTTIYTITVYNNDSTCVAVDSVSVFVNPLTVNAIPNTTVICGNTTNLTANTNCEDCLLNYVWEPATGLNNANIYNPIATPLETTEYSVTVFNNDSTCSAFDNVTITLNPLTISINCSDQYINCGMTTNLYAETNYEGGGNLSFSWEPSEGLNTTNNQNPIANPTQTTTYYVTVSSTEGCAANDSITIYVEPLHAYAYEDVTITCAEHTELDVTTNCYNCTSNSLSYLWSPPIGLSNTTIKNPQANPINTTTYYVSVTTSNGCMSSDSVVVNVEGIVYPISFNTNVQILNAPPFSFQFNNSTPNMNNYDFTWFFGDGSFLSSNNQNIFHTYDFNGLYTVSLVATGLSTGCTDTLVKNDYLYCTGGQEQVVPIAAFTGIPTSLNVGEFVSFSDNSINSPTTWLWDFPGGNPSSSTVKNPSNIQYNTPGTYDVTLIVSNIAGSDNLTKYGYIVVSNTGVEISNFSDNIQVYPNPVSNELIIEIKDNYEQINFEIINIIGQSIYKGSIVEKAIIQTSDFTPGVYLIKFENGEKFEFRKIVKE